MTLKALVNGRIMLDDGFVDDCTILIADGRIQEVARGRTSPPTGAVIEDLAGQMLLPGFIDLQVNGGGGVLFNDAPNVDTIETIAQAHRRFGTTGFLPTLISDRLCVVERGIQAVADAIEQGVPGVLGIHIEGPFISEARRGVHDPSKLQHLTNDLLERIQPLERGKTLLTLAPEAADSGTIRSLTSKGFIVCLGHGDADYTAARSALDEGARGFTHMYNAMSQLTVRAPGMVGAALDSDDAWCGIIADGHHVDPAALRIAYRCKSAAKLMLVSDAMPPVGSSMETFSLGGKTVTVQDGICTDENGVLAGTALDMATAVRNAMRFLQMDLAEAVPLATSTPAQFLGLHEDLGHIREGSAANLIVVDDDLTVNRSYVNGA